MADEAYWEYKAASPTPTLSDAKWCAAVKPDITEEEWYKLSPGMRREIELNFYECLAQNVKQY